MTAIKAKPNVNKCDQLMFATKVAPAKQQNPRDLVDLYGINIKKGHLVVAFDNNQIRVKLRRVPLLQSS
jgi:hypothetical protein